MGSRSDNGGGWPSDGGSDDLPDLPEEWGVIVIPDDLSELSDEVEAIRAELHARAPRTRWQRFAARPGVRRLRRFAMAGMRAPVLIISMAVLVTIASLFASAWPGPPRSPAVQRTADNTDDSAGLETLPAMTLLGLDGRTVPLRAQLPAVVLITDGCDCAQLIADTVTAAGPKVAVITVVSGPASPAPRTAAQPAAQTPVTGEASQTPAKIVRALRDPTSGLRLAMKLGAPDGTAAALIVDKTGQVVRSFPRTASVAELQPHLARL